jgi:hypothetical protein
MATRIETTRNLVNIQSITFIRAITLTLRLTASRPSTPMNVFFDGVKVNHHCAPLGGAVGQSLITDSAGALTITFYLPGGTFTTGTKELFITDAATIANAQITGSVYGSATANFTSTGVTETYQTTTNTVNIVEVEQVVVRSSDTSGGDVGVSDPLAQSFFTYGVTGGCFLTSIDLYFNTKDASIPVRVDVRPLVNGYPQKLGPTDPNMISVVNASAVQISDNASLATKFTFPTPVYLDEDKDYCFVVFSNSRNYNLFTSKLGEKSIESGKTIFEQPYVGSLFKSENNITWSAEQFEDIKFNLNVANFTTTSAATVRFTAKADYFGVPGSYLSTTSGSTSVRVEQTVQHGLEVNSKVDIIADASAVYNGISAANISGERTVTSVPDAYTYTFAAGAAATSTGQISTGGQVRQIQVDTQGSGYTTAPSVTISGGGGTGATATAVISDGKVVAVNMVTKGSGYTTAPTVLFSGGGGSGTLATAVVEASFAIKTNKPVDYLISNIPTLAVSDSTISAHITTTQLNYDGGNLTTYLPAETVDFNVQGRTYLNTHAMIASTTNETVQMGGNPSALVEYSLSTTNSNVSPFIDLRNNPSLIAYSNRLNNQVGEDLTASTSTGVVDDVTLLNSGSGYTTVPNVQLLGGGGTGATAAAVLGTTAVSSVSVTTAGSGYTSAPTVTFSGGGGTGAAGTAVLLGTSVQSIAVTSGGTGYTTEPSIVFSGGGGGTGAIATAVLTAVGVDSATVDSGGTGYTVAPGVVFTGGGGTGATATAVITSGAVTAITITSAGSGYTSAPAISFTGGGGGSGAVATAVLQTRSVASITVNDGGSGYTTTPGILFSGGGGTGAAATATLAPRGVASVTLTNGGSGYTTAPTVAFSGGGGTGAAATTSIAGKSIADIVVTNPGSSYSEAPEVVITRTDASTGVDAIATTTLTTFNSELSADRGTALSRYITKKVTLETPSTGVTLFSEIYSEQESNVDWYIRTSTSGSGVAHDSLEWKKLSCDEERNRSARRGQSYDYKFYLYGLSSFDTYDLKCVLRSSNPAKSPEVNNYRVIIVA